MRGIFIKTYYKEGSIYEVRLGNGTAHKFTSERAVKKFLADTNRFLSSKLFNLNQILCELYTHFREVWMLSNELSYSTNKDRFRSLEHFLKSSYSRANWREGNYYAFIDLKKFCQHAKNMIKLLQEIRHLKQTDTIRKHKLNKLFDTLHIEEFELLNYGQVEAVEFFSTSKIEMFETYKSMFKVA